MMLGGYLAVFGYIFFLIFGVGPLVKKVSDLETSRKVIHTMLFLVWVLITVFFRGTVHQILIPVAFILLNALSYRYDLYKSVERESGNHFGTVYFAIAVTAIMTASYFVPALYPYSGAAVMCLTFGDGFAALVGYHARSRAVKDEKSLAGFLACAGASTASLLVFNALTDTGFSVLQCLLLGVTAAILELMSFGLDNFSVTFGIFALSAVLGLTGAGTGSLLAAVLVFLVVFFSGAITYAGALLSFGIVFVFSCFGGTASLLFLLGMYFAIFLVGLGKKKRTRRKSHSRGFTQIFCNGVFGTLFVILYAVTDAPGCLVCAVIAIGGCFVDSVSSDVGILSKKPPYDLLRRKTVEPGLSGGVTVLGTGASLLASALIGLSVSLVWLPDVGSFFTVTGLVFAQTAVDSFLGSVCQVKYRCPVCHRLTEKKTHCEIGTEFASGLRFLDNNAVNFLSSLLISAAAAAVFLR